MRRSEGGRSTRFRDMVALRRVGAAVALAALLPVAAAATSPQGEAALVARGAALFSGSARLSRGGVACIACHQASSPQVGIPGGRLAVDLTGIYGQIGGDGVAAMLSNPPFAPMAAAYGDRPISDAESAALLAFLRSTSAQASPVARGHAGMLAAGLGGLAVILVLMNLIWSRRKTRSTKDAIYARQRRTC